MCFCCRTTYGIMSHCIEWYWIASRYKLSVQVLKDAQFYLWNTFTLCNWKPRYDSLPQILNRFNVRTHWQVNRTRSIPMLHFTLFALPVCSIIHQSILQNEGVLSIVRSRCHWLLYRLNSEDMSWHAPTLAIKTGSHCFFLYEGNNEGLLFLTVKRTLHPSGTI